MCAIIVPRAIAGIESGKTYRIALAEDTSKSLFVRNASKTNTAEVVLWTETDVPAQQWTVEMGSDGKCAFKNVYSGKYLHYLSKKLVQTSRSTWSLEAVDEEKNIYHIKKTAGYINTGEVIDGINPTLGEPQAWQLIETTPQEEFTEEIRNRMADSYLRQYMQDKGTGFRTFVNGGWGESETLEAILDMYETTGDPRYQGIYDACYAYFKNHVGNNWDGGIIVSGYNWFGYSFNDDVMWHIIGAARAYLLTGNRTLLNDAKRNFDLIWKRAYLGYVGLLRWAEQDGDRNGANSCINGPAAVAACYIAVGTGDTTYFAKARELYANQRIYLYEPNTGKVYDNVVFDPETVTVVSRNTWASTYNQGTMLGAAILLHRHYGDAMYRKDAEKIISYSKKSLCDADGIVKVCQTASGDLQGFKGILMRYAGLYVREYNDTEYADWIKDNAMRAYCNMNSRGFGHSAWLTKAGEDFMYGEDDYSKSPFGGSTALSAAFAVRMSDAIPTTLTTNSDATEHSDTRIVFPYEATQKGRYEIKVYYRTDSRLSMDIAANGGSKQNRYYDNTAGNLYMRQLYLTLRQGSNTIELTCKAGKMPEVEKIEVAWLASVRDVMEAEYAVTKGKVTITNDDLASGGRFVQSVGGGTQNTLTFTFDAEADGEYDLHITYFTADTRQMYVAVNGRKKTYTFNPTGGNTPSTSAIHTESITLTTGTNTIVLGNDNGGAPNVDCIALQRISPDSHVEHPMQPSTSDVAYDLRGNMIPDLEHYRGIFIVKGKKIFVK